MTKPILAAAAAIVASSLLVGVAVAPAMASPDPRPQSEQTQRDSARGSVKKLYCVVQTPTGSRIRTKDCRSRADWIAATGIDPADEVRR